MQVDKLEQDKVKAKLVIDTLDESEESKSKGDDVVQMVHLDDESQTSSQYIVTKGGHNRNISLASPTSTSMAGISMTSVSMASISQGDDACSSDRNIKAVGQEGSDSEESTTEVV